MKERSNFPYYLVLFLISPVLAFLSGAANFRQHSARLILVCFVGIFGFTIIMDPARDSYRHGESLTTFYQHIDFSQFTDEMIGIVSFRGSSTHSDEPVLPIISYTLVQFTTNPAWLFLIIGLIYGFFFINGISLVYNEVHRNWNLALIILFVLFLSWKSFEGINSIRNYTGAWIFFNGAYLYLKTENKKYILLVLAAPLFHIGYLVITLPFFAYYVLGDRRHLFLIILGVSYVLSVSVFVLEPFLMMTEIGESKMNMYSAELLQEQDTDPQSFHAQYYLYASRWAMQIIFIYAILMMGYTIGVHHDRFQYALGSLSILMLAFANLGKFAPVLYNRIFVVFGLFALAYLIRLYSSLEESSPASRYVVYLCLPFILLFVFTQYSMIGDYMDFRVLISPLAYPFLGDDPVSMKEFIRSLLF